MTAAGAYDKVSVMRRRGLLAAAGSFGLVAVVGANAAAADLEGWLRKVSKARAKLKTLQASFEQTRKIGLLATQIKSKGRLTLVLPARLRWDLLPPDNVSYWIGPKGLAMRNSEGVTKLGKTAAGRFAAVLSDLLVLLGGDISKLRKRYAMSLEASKLTLVPKAKAVAKHVRRLELDTGAAMLVERVTIVENNGDTSTIVFGKYTKNAKVDPKRMKPPKK